MSAVTPQESPIALLLSPVTGFMSSASVVCGSVCASWLYRNSAARAILRMSFFHDSLLDGVSSTLFSLPSNTSRIRILRSRSAAKSERVPYAFFARVQVRRHEVVSRCALQKVPVSNSIRSGSERRRGRARGAGKAGIDVLSGRMRRPRRLQRGDDFTISEQATGIRDT